MKPQFKELKLWEYRICSAYAPYIINGDSGDMTDSEIKDVDNFLSFVANENGLGHWDCYDMEEAYERCDIYGDFASCLPFRYIVLEG